MQNINLGGSWSLKQDNNGELLKGHLPGCTYLDLMANGKIEDPFWGMNENVAKEVAQHDYEYSREFSVTDDFLDAPSIEIVADGLDTLTAIRLNGELLGETNNINRTWRFNAKPLLLQGNNKISISIKNPFPYIEEKQAENQISGLDKRSAANGHIRKTPCHFGWDWGPALPPAGLVGEIKLESYELRFGEMRILQDHQEGNVRVEVTAELLGNLQKTIVTTCYLTAPDGTTLRYPAKRNNNTIQCSIPIDNPQLWWCNGLGEQPLYTVELVIEESLGDETVRILDRCKKIIGLRTIKLNTSPDQWGNQFRFEVNGVPVFAKGANWIPSDSFETRTSKEVLEFYIKSAKHANMNMLRVWGGGRYESDEFYGLCDRYGILIWQDFIFACNGYPFFDPEFLDNVHQEVIDNVTRLRHHASLALWNGNNENELLRMFWKKGSRMYESNMGFYHKTLPGWLSQLDDVTAYWPGSPSSGSLEYKTHDMNRGDTHLWQIWHGMLPIEAFRKYPTRFCSEFGMESMPSMHTIRSFTDEVSPKLFDPVIQLHQKSIGGNEKMLFYLLAKYRNPKKFEDFIYLSQLVQSDTIRFASERWRREMGRHNGALYWQFNDCWPVASWASIDYGRQYKALQYHAKHFNKMLCISNDYYNDRVELHIINEYPRTFNGELCWSLYTFKGELISEGTVPANVEGTSARKIITLHFSQILNGVNKNKVMLFTSLRQDNQTVDEKTYLLVPDRKTQLPKPNIKMTYETENDTLKISLISDVFARYVYLEVDEITEPWSDNFFDLLPGKAKTIIVNLPQGTDCTGLKEKLKVRSLAGMEQNNSIMKDKLLRFSMRFKKANLMTWLIFKFLL